MMRFIRVFVNDFQIEVEDDSKDIFHDIMVPALKKNKKIITGKMSPTTILIAPLDNMSFHYEESFLKWKYLHLTRIALERKLSKENLTFEEVVELIEEVIVKDNENLMIIDIYVEDIVL